MAIYRIDLVEDLSRLGDNLLSKRAKKTDILFNLQEKDLNTETGDRIMGFLQHLKANNLSFKVVRPLPPCLFGFRYAKVIKDYDVVKSCRDCIDLFSVNDKGNIQFCKALSKEGPELKYMPDRDQIHEYFSILHDQLNPPKKCRSCRYHMRGQCNSLCLRKKR